MALVAHGGDPADDRAKGVMAPTPHLAALPYVRRLLASLDSVIGRTRLMRIEEEGELTSHIDTNYYWRDHLRVHFPVRTTPDVRFECAGEVGAHGRGRGVGLRHLAFAPGGEPVDAPRIHLVVDTVGSAAFWQRIDRRPTPRRLVVAIDSREPPHGDRA